MALHIALDFKSQTESLFFRASATVWLLLIVVIAGLGNSVAYGRDQAVRAYSVSATDPGSFEDDGDDGFVQETPPEDSYFARRISILKGLSIGFGMFALPLGIVAWHAFGADANESFLKDLSEPVLSRMFMVSSIGTVGAVVIGAVLAGYYFNAMPAAHITLRGDSLWTPANISADCLGSSRLEVKDDIIRCRWKSADGGQQLESNERQTSFLYRTPGKKQVTLEVFDFFLRADVVSTSFTVKDGAPKVLLNCTMEPYTPALLTCDGGDSYSPPERGLSYMWQLDSEPAGTNQSREVFVLREARSYPVQLSVVDTTQQTQALIQTYRPQWGGPQANITCQLTPNSFTPTQLSCDAEDAYSPINASFSLAWALNFVPQGAILRNITLTVLQNYTVVLNATDRESQSSLINKTVTPQNGAPQARFFFTYSQNFHSAPVVVNFTSTSFPVNPRAQLANAFWRILNETMSGSYPALQSIFREFSTPGNHTVSLMVVDDLGNTSPIFAQDVLVESPNPKVSVDILKSNSGLHPSYVRLDPRASRPNAPNTTLARFEWSSLFPEFDRKTTYPPDGYITGVVLYPGTYEVTLTVHDDHARMSSLPITFSIR